VRRRIEVEEMKHHEPAAPARARIQPFAREEVREDVRCVSKKRIRKICLALAVISAGLAGPSLAAEMPPPARPQQFLQSVPPRSHPPLDRAIRRQQSRQAQINLDVFFDTLGLAKGMSILDIGAGPGYASFLFAEKLQGSGEVYATDIRSDFVDHIAAEAKKRGLVNLSSAVVAEQGLDEFYARHRYDLVFLSNVYHALDARVDYFTRLRGFLKPGARLVAILYNQTPLFSEDDFPRHDDFVKRLGREAADSPFVMNLSEVTRGLLRDMGNAQALKSALVEDFNRMLQDPHFYRHFYQDSYFTEGLFTPPERDLANWLLMTLTEDGALDDAFDRKDERKMRTVIKLNRLFFSKRFGDYLAGGGRGAYIPAGDANRHTSKYVMLKELDVAGYQFVEELRLSPYYDAVILAPKAP
jgi:SAM-dependent methyltransferase